MSEKLPIQNETSTIEARRENIFQKYEDQFSDPILSVLKTEVSEKWEETSEQNKENIIKRLEEFIEALEGYYDSYNGLKAAARKERMFYLDIEKFKDGVKNADARERMLHDNFMSAANILSRTLKKAGLNIAWRGDNAIYNPGGKNDSHDSLARDKFREWMFRIYHEEFPS